MRTHAPQQTTSLFDDLVGGGEESRGDGPAHRLRGFQVNDQFELRNLLNG